MTKLSLILYSENYIENTMAGKDEIIFEQEEFLEKRGSIIIQQEGHIAGLRTEMEENDKYLSELVDGKGRVRVKSIFFVFSMMLVTRKGRFELE